MKKITLTLIIVISATILLAQPPQAFKYQTVVRDNTGEILANQDVSFQISILEGSTTGNAIYVETHDTITNEFGLVNLEIGNGSIVSDVFADIVWGDTTYFLQVEMDENGGDTYQLMGTSQLLSVPYSLYSESTGDTTRWRKNNNHLYYKSGRVGIGITTPERNLDIRSNLPTTTSKILLGNSDNSTNLLFNSGHETANPYISFKGMNALRFIRYDGGLNELMRLESDGRVGIGTASPDESAILDLNSNSLGFLLPRLSSAEIQAISNPTDGLQVYNTTDGKIYIYVALYSEWKELSYGNNGLSTDCGFPITDPRDQQVYNTVKIGDQCWMAENLNIGIRKDGVWGGGQLDNDTIEKFCYDDLESNCELYGGLYIWNEMMEYTEIEGAQGICPPGWHIPTDMELCDLDVYADASAFNCLGGGGIDNGYHLKSTSGWSSGGNGNDIYGFNVLPSGWYGGDYYELNNISMIWSSTIEVSNRRWRRLFEYDKFVVQRDPRERVYPQSVRCLKD